MFDIAPTEMLVVAAIALVVIGPKELPRVLRMLGGWIGRARGMARHFRSGLDTMMREAELAEMEKKWREDNDRIMRDHPPMPAEVEEPPTPSAPPAPPPPPAPPSGPAAP